MRDLAFGDQLDLADLGFSDWLDRLAQVDSDDVFVEFLGKITAQFYKIMALA